MTRDGHDVKWFEVCDAKGTWFPARVRLGEDRQTLHVYTSYKARLPGAPSSVRHAWMNIAMPNLVNSAGYPVSVFATTVRQDVK